MESRKFHHAIVSLTHGSSSSSSMSMMGIVDALFIESCRPFVAIILSFPDCHFSIPLCRCMHVSQFVNNEKGGSISLIWVMIEMSSLLRGQSQRASWGCAIPRIDLSSTSGIGGSRASFLLHMLRGTYFNPLCFTELKAVDSLIPLVI